MTMDVGGSESATGKVVEKHVFKELRGLGIRGSAIGY